MLQLLQVAACQPKNVHSHTQQCYQISYLHVSFKNLKKLEMAGWIECLTSPTTSQESFTTFYKTIPLNTYI